MFFFVVFPVHKLFIRYAQLGNSYINVYNLKNGLKYVINRFGLTFLECKSRFILISKHIFILNICVPLSNSMNMVLCIRTHAYTYS